MPLPARYVIGLGSNLGDRLVHLVRAADQIRGLGRVLAFSAVYESAAWGGPEQGPFLNAALALEVALDPARLLAALLEIERDLGRQRRERWGPRTIDLDLLWADGVVVDTLGVRWHHYPSSFDFRVGSANGPLLASVGVIRYPSVAAAEASSRVRQNGRRELLVIRPIEIVYVAREGEGARQRVVISAADAARLRESGLLKQRGRILTVYKNNY
ncbi:MAG: 2-amino-4-hydroxy-6-hydroxymethyldihydropteridine diphosphokinase [Armatimonadetes bacterium]|nr:2-amino-4-hydroxy-6-hydroxymethyldihydropteridine diphosphokinase [Armatimonadota bacterium]